MAASITAAGATAGATMAAAIASASASSGALKFLPGFSSGGYTGPGRVDQPKGIVHAEEIVWSKRDIARAGGLATVEAMRRGVTGYATGGIVGQRTAVEQLRGAASRLGGFSAAGAPAEVRLVIEGGAMFVPTIEQVAGNVSVKTTAAGVAYAQHQSKQSARRQKQGFRI